MRVLLLHNRYRADGGEERAVAEIAALLRQRGHAVAVLERTSVGLGRGRAARALLGGGLDTEEIERAVGRLRADVVHAHNLHPLLGWRGLAAARAAGAKTVMHLHNFRLFCSIGIAYRDRAPCFRCQGANTLPGLLHRCRGTVAQAAVYAAALHAQQPRCLDHTDRFLAVSESTAGRLIALGLPADRTTVLPNFIPRAGFAEHSRAAEGSYALVAGRLVEEKGFDTAIIAARSSGVPLVVAGEGPDEVRLRRLAADGKVSFTGRLTESELADVRSAAAIVLAPSRWEEPCPYAVLDAVAAGVPTLVSDRGGLPELVPTADALPAEDVEAWGHALSVLWRQRRLRGERGEAALAFARERFGEDRYYDALTRVYAGIEPPASRS